MRLSWRTTMGNLNSLKYRFRIHQEQDPEVMDHDQWEFIEESLNHIRAAVSKILGDD